MSILRNAITSNEQALQVYRYGDGNGCDLHEAVLSA